MKTAPVYRQTSPVGVKGALGFVAYEMEAIPNTHWDYFTREIQDVIMKAKVNIILKLYNELMMIFSYFQDTAIMQYM